MPTNVIRWNGLWNFLICKSSDDTNAAKTNPWDEQNQLELAVKLLCGLVIPRCSSVPPNGAVSVSHIKVSSDFLPSVFFPHFCRATQLHTVFFVSTHILEFSKRSTQEPFGSCTCFVRTLFLRGLINFHHASLGAVRRALCWTACCICWFFSNRAVFFLTSFGTVCFMIQGERRRRL